jgi:lipooligosaccharide transport system ATP-binding protein
MSAAITVRNVRKTYKKLTAVDSLSFSVDRGECFGLLGPNGAGKTTMIKILYGKALRDTPQPGQVDIFGFDPLTHELEIKYLSGIVPQENNLDLELSVIQNLLIYARFYGHSRRKVISRIEYLLEFMELIDKRNDKIKELSGGLKRRLIIARALINEPKLLILDEPTTGLDPQVRNVIWDRLRHLLREGVTIMLTTHYMEEAFQLCNRLIIMNEGRNVLEGNPSALLKEHIEPYVLELFDIDHKYGSQFPGSIRVEGTESRLLLYAQDFQELQQISEQYGAGEYYLRQSNLEDLFLKTTGRQLNE